MTPEQLHTLIQTLEQELTAAKQAGRTQEVDILMQKVWIARSYLIDPQVVHPGKTYAVADATDKFTVSYLNGVMAWGQWTGTTTLVAIPIARLSLA